MREPKACNGELTKPGSKGTSITDETDMVRAEFNRAMNEDFHARLEQSANLVNQRLDELLQPNCLPGEIARPENLIQAMRHGVLNGGKRVRPFLVIECATLFGCEPGDALETACALECLHCYSLVHDDLPAMDDDDLRRGQPTVHKAFDEATAILAGDGLLTFAFDLITNSSGHPDPSIRAELAGLLARAAGMGGMIGGQVLDIEAESGQLDADEIKTLQAMKTGALIRYACEAGAVIGKANQQQRAALISYGETIGLAFQLADDLLDVTSNTQAMGKAVGKDADQGKGTLVGIYGVERVEILLAKAVEKALTHMESFGSDADCLRQTAQFIAKRKN